MLMVGTAALARRSGRATAAASPAAPAMSWRRVGIRRSLMQISLCVKAVSAAGPMHDAVLCQDEEAVERDTHDRDEQDSGHDIVAAQKPPGIEDQPADAARPRDHLGGDQRRIDDADGEPGADENLA